jgi:hypothetical protein
LEKRTRPTLIGTAMKGARRPAPADHTASIGILWAWASFAQSRATPGGTVNRNVCRAESFTLAA